MPLDPQVREMLAQMAGQLPNELKPVAQTRAEMDRGGAVIGGPPEPVARVEDRRFPGPGGEIPVRIYWPEGDGPLPALVYLHGGGWVLGSIVSTDSPCRTIANRGGCVVISVDYRLAPEHRFPAAAEDTYAAVRRVAENAAALGVDPARIAVGGSSAGGNLAAVASLMARDRGGPPIAYQVLIYPVTDYVFDTPSYHENAEGYMLTRNTMIWYWANYLGDEADGRHPYASPARAESLAGLPPALVITAEYDPLRDEGEAYARRLEEAGVPVTLRRYEGMIHGVLSRAGVLEGGRRALADLGDALRAALHA